MLTLGVGLVAAAPVVASTIRALAAGWMPVADQGIIATRAFDVLTSNSPLVGQYTAASAVTGRATYSPGPLLYWLLALPARVGPSGLVLAMGALNTAAIVAIVALARARGGAVLMLLTATALAVMCRSWAPENLHAILNAAAPLLPFTLLIFLCWSVACGEHRLLPVAVLVAGFVVQTHLVFLAPTLGLLAVGLVGLVASRRRAGAAAEVRSLRLAVLAAVVVAAVTWSAPVYQELTGRHGNLTMLARTAASRTRAEGVTAGGRAVIRAVGVRPRWLRGPQATAGRIGSLNGGDYGDTRLLDIWTAPSALGTASTALLLIGLVAVGVFATRRRRGDLAAGAAIGLVLCIALGAVAAATPADLSGTLGYGLWWGSAAGMWVWLMLGWSVVSLWPVLQRAATAPPRALLAALGAVLLLAGGLVSASQGADAHRAFYRPTQSLAAQVDRAVPGGATVSLMQRGWSGLDVIKPAIRYTLRRRGIRALSPGAALRSGWWYEQSRRHRGAVLSLASAVPARALGGTVVARADLRDDKGRHRIVVTLSRAGGQHR
jgi:hypothetical protein